MEWQHLFQLVMIYVSCELKRYTYWTVHFTILQCCWLHEWTLRWSSAIHMTFLSHRMYCINFRMPLKCTFTNKLILQRIFLCFLCHEWYLKRLLLYVLLHKENLGKITRFTLINVVNQLFIAFWPSDAMFEPNFSSLLHGEEVLQYTAVNLKSKYIQSTALYYLLSTVCSSTINKILRYTW